MREARTGGDSPDGDGRGWWRGAVIYEIYIRSFADSDGNGIGDITGIRSRLGYLRDLGVDAIWITPWYPSPMADGGYDVADYRDIHPEFGTLADAEELIGDAHRHGLRVLIDLVPNHTSHRHRWFHAALASPPGSPQRARYVFRTGLGPGGERPPNDWTSAFGGPAWTRLPGEDQWYLHLFAPEQPDLNWENPEVRREFTSILRFWLDRGVDGLRIDVANALVKDQRFPDIGPEELDVLEPTKLIDHPHWDREGVHEIYRSWRRIADEYPGERVFVAEAWVPTPRQLARYVRPDELHSAFNFDLLRCTWDAERMRQVIDDNLEAMGEVGAPPTWVLSNHDVTRHLTRYGRPHTAGLGPRTELIEPVDLELGLRRARAAALLMLALPGGAYVYQGEEIGLWEVEDLPDELLQDPTFKRSGGTARGRDGCRVPIPWSGDSPPFGFGPDGTRPWLPQPPEWKHLTVEAEFGDPASTLELYRSALRIRRDLPAFGEGDLQWLDGPPGALLFERGPTVLCAVNLSADPFPLPEHTERLLASVQFPGNRLPPNTAVWLRRTA
jgi:alpha-glucosidase